MAEVTLTLEEYEALREMAIGAAAPIIDKVIVKPVKRRASAASKRYGRAFKKVAPRYKLKSGRWKVNGFRSAVRAAHKLAKTSKKI
jgi:hypothetical protein